MRSGLRLWEKAKRRWAEGSTGCMHATATDNMPSAQLDGMPLSKQMAMRKQDLLEVLEPPGRDWVKVQKDAENQGYVPRTLIKLTKYTPVVPGQINSVALLEAHMLGSRLDKKDARGYAKLRKQVEKVVCVIFDDGPFLWDCTRFSMATGMALYLKLKCDTG